MKHAAILVRSLTKYSIVAAFLIATSLAFYLWRELNTDKMQEASNAVILELTALSEIKQMAIELAGPGNNVFQSKDINSERREFEQLYARYRSSMYSTDSYIGSSFEKDLEKIFHQFQLIKEYSERIFLNLERNEPSVAAAEMALMDQATKKVFTLTSEIERTKKRELHQLQQERAFQSRLNQLAILLLSLSAAAVMILATKKLRHSHMDAQSIDEETSKLRDLNDSYRKTMDHAGIVSVTDRNGVILYVNQTFCEVSQYTQEELIGKTHKVVNSKCHSEEFWKNFWSHIKMKSLWRGEICNRAKNGDEYWVDTLVVPLLDKEGNIEKYFSFRRLITEEKRNEQILASLDRVHRAYFSINDLRLFFEFILNELLHLTNSEYGFIGEILKDPLTGNQYLKTYAITNIAWSDETRAFYEKNAPQGLEFRNLKTIFGQTISTGKIYISNDPSNDPNRTGIPFGHPPLNSFLGVPLYAGETLIGMFGVANRKNGYSQSIVSDLQALTDSLAHLVDNARKHKAVEEEKIKLASKSKMATLGEMAGGIAHEINNPLAIIQSSAALLKTRHSKGQLDDVVFTQTLDKIASTSSRISKIINGLRSFARDGDQDPFESTRVSSILSDTLPLCEARLKNHGVELQILPFNDSLEIFCRPIQISQIILNLISNATDAISSLEKKWINIEVSEDNGFVVFAITDSGEGIPSEIAEKIMNPFFTTKEVGKGTGLGLSISLGIIREHSGKFYLDRRSKNTRFVFEIPKQSS